MTTMQKLGLAALIPAAFAFTVTTGEIVGGVVMLAGVGVATLGPRDPRPDRLDSRARTRYAEGDGHG